LSRFAFVNILKTFYVDLSCNFCIRVTLVESIHKQLNNVLF